MWSRYAENFVCQSKGQESPNLASFSNQKDSKIFDFQSNIQSSIPWISWQRFDLVSFYYIYTIKPYSCIRETTADKAIATLKKNSRNLKIVFQVPDQFKDFG